MTNVFAVIVPVVVVAVFGFCNYEALCANGKLQRNNIKVKLLDYFKDNLDYGHLESSDIKPLEQMASKIAKL